MDGVWFCERRRKITANRQPFTQVEIKERSLLFYERHESRFDVNIILELDRIHVADATTSKVENTSRDNFVSTCFCRSLGPA